MRLTDIALNNIRRRKTKIVFLVVGMMIGIAAIVSITQITSALREDVSEKLDEFGANIIIVPRSNTLSMSYGGVSIPGAQYEVKEIAEQDLKNLYEIRNKENLATVSAKLLGSIQVEGTPVLLVGTDLASEIKLKKWWEFTQESDIHLARESMQSPIDSTVNTTVTQIKDLRKTDVILGSTASQILGKKPGDDIVINDTEYTVKGVLKETGSQDDSILFMGLSQAQTLLGKNDTITLVEVAAICSGCPVEEMAKQINEKLPQAKATPVKAVVESRMQTINQLANFGYTLGAVVLVIGSLIVFTTMSSSVNERTREFGVLRAIGFRRSHIIRLVFTEALIVSATASLLGYILGLGAYLAAGPYLTDTSTKIEINIVELSLTLALGIIISTLATIYPAQKAAKIDPQEALRQI
ncbi:MAG: FtsX-like permease family protein [Candidatus Altiarchaeales archaeon]|nr:FtsX-like permease family protein [Candidatus Altiarchaeales archaeon]